MLFRWLPGGSPCPGTGQKHGGIPAIAGDAGVLVDFEADEGPLERRIGVHSDSHVGEPPVQRARQVNESAPLRSSKG
jgi:hypothetical protein